MSGSVTKSILTDKLIAKNQDISYEVAKNFVDDFFKGMSDAILDDNSLNISGFGSFNVRAKNARPGRNPKTGEPYEISSRNVVSFQLGYTFKNLLVNK